MSARRAVARWSLRMFRREWRQQLLVLALVTVSVAGAVFFAAFAYHAPTPGEAYFGNANFSIDIEAPSPAVLDASLRDVRSALGIVEVIGRYRTAVPGSTDTLDVRLQDPDGVYGAPILKLLDGRYPTTTNEIAVTRKAARLFGTGIGRTAKIGDDTRTVVGLVENPADLSDQFVLEPPVATPFRSARVLVRSTEKNVQALPASLRPGPGEPDPTTAQIVGISRRGSDDNAGAAALGFGMGAVLMLLVCLVAAAGFVVIAQRRSRQLGMMAAVGAADRHLRLVVVVNGALVGAVAAVVGNVLAFTTFALLSGPLQRVVEHRWGRFDVPWWIPAVGAVLAVATATAAAWWPARAVARTPVVQALSGRPPAPRPVHRSSLVAIGLLVGGFVAIAWAIDVKHDKANVPFMLVGVLAVATGMLLVSPVAVRLIASTTRRLPFAPRLALRDLGRHQSRSGAALAAISLALGVATAITVVASAAQASPTSQNLSDRQVLFHLGTGKPGLVRSGIDTKALGTQVQQFAQTLASARVVPLMSASSANTPPAGVGKGAAGDGAELVQQPLAILARQISGSSDRRGPRGGGTFRDAGVLYVATPELLEYLGIDSVKAANVDVLTWAPGNLGIFNAPTTERDAAPISRHIAASDYTSAPRSLITQRGLERFGLTPVASGWVVESSRPLTNAQQTSARALGAQSGLLAETRDEQKNLATTKTVATAAGILLAFAILAMTVGLVRSEAAADLRTLTATGASISTRRSLTAATAGALAFVAALLGTAGAYAALVAGYLDRLRDLRHVPIGNVAVIVLVMPLIAAAGGWLLAGREPSAVSRQPLAT